MSDGKTCSKNVRVCVRVRDEVRVRVRVSLWWFWLEIGTAGKFGLLFDKRARLAGNGRIYSMLCLLRGRGLARLMIHDGWRGYVVGNGRI